MKRILIIIGLVAATLIALIAIGLGILLYTIDPNDYKGEISQMVRDATGRELVFEEDISATMFPWLGLKTGRLRLSDGPGFSQGSFLEVQSAGFKLDVLPLISGTIRIGEVTLDGVRLKLEVDAAGRKNWEMKPETEKAPGSKPDAPAEKPGQGSPGASAGVSSDNSPAVATAPDKVSSKASDKNAGSGMDLSVDSIQLTDCKISYTDLAKNASYSLELPELLVSDITPGGKGSLKGTAMVTDRVTGMAIHLNIDGSVHMADNFALQSADISELGLTLDTAAQKELVTLDLKLDFSASEQKLNVSSLSGKLGTADFKGSCVALLPGAKGLAKDLRLDVRGNLEMGSLDVDALLSQLGQDRGKSGQSHAGKDAGDKGDEGKNNRESGGSTFAVLAGVYAEFDFSAKEVITSGFSITDIKIPIKADRGVVTIEPYSFSMLDGKASGLVKADLTQKTPALRLTNAITGLQVGGFFKGGAGKAMVRGILTSNLDVNGAGLDWNTIAPSLNGSGDFQVANGEVHNLVLIPGGVIPGLEAKLPSDFSLDKLSGTYKITKGIATNNDFTLLSPLLKATGGGTVNLPSESLDFEADVALPGIGAVLPAYAKGKFSNLSYGVDSKKLLQNLTKNRLTDGLKDALPQGPAGSDRPGLKNLGDGIKKLF